MPDTKFYDGTRLLSMKDINGNTPEIYICTTNNNAGKTTWFNRYMVNNFLKKGKTGKFCIEYRYKTDLPDCANSFFGDIGPLFFPGYNMINKPLKDGKFQELILLPPGVDKAEYGMPCGYAIALNAVDDIKRNSHLFNDTEKILFDEFQSESNRYCTNEVDKFRAVHKAIARGHGKQVRYVPVYMVGNPISIINPYYVAMGISDRLTKNTHFLKGPGFVLETGFNESASKAQKSSGFNAAFGNDKYAQYTTDAVYLMDDMAFIEKPSGASSYMATIVYGGQSFAIREMKNTGYLYCDTKVDDTYPVKIALTNADMQPNLISIKRYQNLLLWMKQVFQIGGFRFRNQVCKTAIFYLVEHA